MPAASAKKNHFKKIQSFKADYTLAEFTQYESERTGMRVAVCDRKGPKVQGYFALATEIHDDSGAPHTLEHLCFMGSRSYPYKGVLDRLATRSYSNTNAWTATDHTAYTLDSAGWEGFAQILPVYLDHVILPTLTDEGCYTEVHHIDGEGQDAGVVYSEMQGVQNNQGELMDLQARRLLYPEGVGFRYETGGMMEQLRVLTAQRIRDFHREMYQPKNLRLVLIGEVDHAQLLDILEDFEESILDAIPPPDAPFRRPWVEPKQPQALKKTIIDTVEFPEDDESMGELMIAFFGPPGTDMMSGAAMDVLLSYLSDSTASVLVNTLVEKEAVASGVYNQVDNRPDTVIWFILSSVATEKLEAVEQRFFEVLQETSAKPLDMPYLKDCVRRYKRRVMFHTESSNEVFADPIIEDHLFGNRDGSDLYTSLANLNLYDELEKWTDEQWRIFMGRWLSHAHHVSILGKPSAELSKQLKADEKARVKAQQEKFGEDGLKDLAKKLEHAKAENDKPMPKEVLEQFEIPGTDSIHFFETITARSGYDRSLDMPRNKIQDIINKDAGSPNFFIHFEHIPTNFVHFSLVLNTQSVPLEMKPLLPVFLSNFFNTPVMRDGETVAFEKIVTELEQDTVSFQIETGANIGNSELLRIKFVVEPEKYQTMIKWLELMLLHGHFDLERLRTTVKKLLADVPDEKRSGNDMLYAVDNMIHYDPKSSGRAQNTLVKALYLKRVLYRLKKMPDWVLDHMHHLRKNLITSSNMRALVVANIENLPYGPASSFDPFVAAIQDVPHLNPIDSRADVLSIAGRNPGQLNFIVPMPTIDSSFLLATTKGPNSYTHPDLPALMVATAYLDTVEGPLWTSVRGTGLAYGTGFSRGTDTGLLRFRVYRSPDAWKAYATARGVVEDFISGKRAFEKPVLEGAISSIVVEFVDEQPTMSSAAAVSFVNSVIKGVGKGYSEEMLRKVREVGEAEIKRVLEEVVLPVFLPGKADVVVTAASIMEEGLEKNFKEAGFRPQVKPLSFFQDDYGLEPLKGELEEPESEEDEDEDEDDSEGGEEGEEGEETEEEGPGELREST
ncbi:putative zinc metalloprotease [Mytilinidion resinicola]|uniref:Presequence protease, mitochondrial n=1 Tax=Mytilinidion resinicola TaxID=574789 RepID=A0A6A6Y8J5_9PEZI|nr:putative zinc metalloprotease [Mytilinidion resinicola]KAF2804284.1 putative zinc metalloprotease [Mytilinidion resinicola]